MGNWKGTKGNWFACCISSKPHFLFVGEEGITICGFHQKQHDDSEIPIEEIRANAELIADAGNTIQECDLLPSELLDQRNELLENLQHAVNSLKAVASFGATKPIIERFQNVINKISK